MRVPSCRALAAIALALFVVGTACLEHGRAQVGPIPGYGPSASATLRVPPTLDGHATGSCASCTSTTVTLTTLNPQDIIPIFIAEFAGSSIVTSITGGGLTFVARGTPQVVSTDAYEIWWAKATNPLTAVVITINVSASNVALVANAFGVTGANLSAPFDANVSLPALANGSSGTPSVSGVSTTSPAVMLLGGSFNNNGGTQTAGAGFTLIDSKVQGLNGNANEFKLVNSQQSSISVAFGSAPGGTVWTMWADAIKCSAC